MPKTVTEPSRELPVIASVDVVVCGGGPSGFIAAIAAARNGAKTLLLEHYGFLGGMATAGMVGPISKFNLNGERIVGGIPAEFIADMHRRGGAIIDLPSGNIPYDPEVYKYAAMRMVSESGVDLLLHSSVCGCLFDEENPRKISHVIVENKSGRQAIETRYVIDCTGTGDVVARTSVPWEMRGRSNGELQPLSLYFRLGGVDTDQLNLLMAHDNTKYSNPELRQLLQAEVEAGRLPNFGGPWALHGSTLRRGEVSVNATRFSGNAVVARELSDAEIQLRTDSMHMVNVFREKAPAFRNSYLIDTATQVGIRETRAIQGLYTLTADDVLTPRHFADTVAMGGHPVDIHRAGSSQQEVRFIQKPYHIPYRCLVPQNADNLLVAGGCLSATREAFASVRVQAQCMALGQAAGTAAALCADQQRAVHELDGSQLRAVLTRQGGIV
ncbi:FAD-dependent oxidoreductase [Larkinella bovis]